MDVSRQVVNDVRSSSFIVFAQTIKDAAQAGVMEIYNVILLDYSFISM